MSQEYRKAGQDQKLDVIDKQLLNLLQNDFSLVSRPFAVFAEKLGISEEEAIARTQRMKDELGIIRQISAIFDTRRLGYRSMLVAMKVDPERVDEAAAIINCHPGISHNYLRTHVYNLWFTIAVHPQHDIEEVIHRLHREAGAEKTWMLPTLRLFKIGVDLDMTGEQEVTRKAAPKFSWQTVETFAPPTEEDIRVIRVLQRDMPLIPEPFKGWALALGCPEEEMFQRAEDLKERKLMRRFSAVLHHRSAGFKSNPMGVWVVPEERVEDVGTRMASYTAVSHCYQRPTYPDWPYSIFTMIHGRSKEDCEKVIQAISEETGITQYAVLWSTKEYKKTRVQYFVEETGGA